MEVGSEYCRAFFAFFVSFVQRCLMCETFWDIFILTFALALSEISADILNTKTLFGGLSGKYKRRFMPAAFVGERCR